MFGWLRKRKAPERSPREKRLAELHPLFRTVDAGLQVYVEIIRTNPTWEDDRVYEELCRRGIESRLAQDLVAFVPLAFARVIVIQLVPVLPDTFRLHNTADASVTEESFATEIAFMWAKEVASMYYTAEHREVFQQITSRSAELQALNNALYGAPPGLSNEDLKRIVRESRFSPPEAHLHRPRG